ncbi:MAG TPA: hypothetical protein VJ301_18480 [Propionibacteriaceae bacterium]|nr:hypothetical protein [Propionibacteriaceae bacterium]
MINNHHRWSLLAILGSAVLLLTGTGLFLIVRHDARATTSPLPPSGEPPPASSPTPLETDPRWSDWDDLGGSFNAGPSVASWSANRLDVFARAGQTMLHRAYDGRKWHPPEDLDIAVSTWGPDRLDLFCKGDDNTLDLRLNPE